MGGGYSLIVGNIDSRNSMPDACGEVDQTTDARDKNIGVSCCSVDGSTGSRPGCKQGVGYKEAKEHCEANNMRLCTADEINTKKAAGSGCGFDANMVWTSTDCGEKNKCACPA